MLKLSTASNVMVLMTDSADHVSGKTGLTLAIEASKNGGAFASISPTVTERSYGWYSLAITSSHTDTLGDLVFHVTATGADPTDLREQVFTSLPGENATLSSSERSAIADAMFPRNIAGGSDGGRTFQDALRAIRNKSQISGGVLTVYEEDDVTVAWTASVTTSARDPITSIDPA